MIASTLSNILQNVAVSVISGILVPILLAWILNKKTRPKFTMNHRVALSLILAAAVFGVLYFFVNPTPEVRVVQTDDTAAPVSENGLTHYDVKLSGYVTHWKGDVRLVVKPVNSQFWYIQPPTIALGQAENGGRNWIGHALFSTNAEGTGEEFIIYAIATPTKYQGNEALSTKPDGYESDPITLTRHR
ncbi:MAG TPA: hypothetical protein VN776_15150 [Terracidiphilus sp.]|nr:hypothetical protein [Terracidiphilus sp.]